MVVGVEAEGGEAPVVAKFIGERRHTLDPKGRLILPSKHREKLEEGMVMTAWLDRCLTVLPVEDWGRVMVKVRKLSSTDAQHRRFARMVLSMAHEDTPDRQGRVTIPAHLRDFAHLDKDVTVVGADDHLELWNTQSWAEYRFHGLDEFADTNQSLGGVL